MKSGERERDYSSASYVFVSERFRGEYGRWEQTRRLRRHRQGRCPQVTATATAKAFAKALGLGHFSKNAGRDHRLHAWRACTQKPTKRKGSMRDQRVVHEVICTCCCRANPVASASGYHRQEDKRRSRLQFIVTSIIASVFCCCVVQGEAVCRCGTVASGGCTLKGTQYTARLCHV